MKNKKGIIIFVSVLSITIITSFFLLSLNNKDKELQILENETIKENMVALSSEQLEPTTKTIVIESKTEATTKTIVTEPKTQTTTKAIVTEPKTQTTTKAIVTEPKTEATTKTIVTELKTQTTTKAIITEPETEATTKAIVTEPKTEATTKAIVTEPKTEATTKDFSNMSDEEFWNEAEKVVGETISTGKVGGGKIADMSKYSTDGTMGKQIGN